MRQQDDIAHKETLHKGIYNELYADYITSTDNSLFACKLLFTQCTETQLSVQIVIPTLYHKITDNYLYT